jgi:hypothetical protein
MSRTPNPKQDKTQQYISLGTLVTGLFLLLAGYRRFLPFLDQADQFFSVSPDTYATYLLIAGAAFVVAGFVGLIRGKVI